MDAVLSSESVLQLTQYALWSALVQLATLGCKLVSRVLTAATLPSCKALPRMNKLMFGMFTSNTTFYVCSRKGMLKAKIESICSIVTPLEITWHILCC